MVNVVRSSRFAFIRITLFIILLSSLLAGGSIYTQSANNQLMDPTPLNCDEHCVDVGFLENGGTSNGDGFILSLAQEVQGTI